MTYLQSGEKRDCFGCGACEQACPVQAIAMQPDSEGFLYPVVSENCIDCGQCVRVCPVEGSIELRRFTQTVAAFHLEPRIRSQSASGGVFGAIVAVADEKSVVFGAKWEGRSKVCHAGTSAQRAYELFRKSKYIQSRIGHSYKEVRDVLLADKSVIFTGTPCQIAGLKQFLGRDYPNLLCVDLICHGVPSEKVLEAYLLRMDRKNDPVIRIDFRSKMRSAGKWDSKFAELYYRSGKRIVVDYDSSGFLRGFANGLFFRPSCSTCPFAQSARISDLTIGDYWGIEQAIPSLNPHEGVSLVLVNSEKGQKYLQKMASYLQMFPTEPEPAIQGNARLRKPDPGHRERMRFFAELEETDFERLIQQIIPRVSMVRKLGYKLKKFLRKG